MTHRWYLFLDEGGDLNFKGNGSRFFTVSSLATRRPFELAAVLADLRFDVIEEGLDIEYFHASEDRQAVRDRVFDAVVSHLDSVRLHSVVVEKSTVPLDQRDEAHFYSEKMGRLLGGVVRQLVLEGATEIIVITDRLPLKSRRGAIEKAVKQTLARVLPHGTSYRVLHHASMSAPLLQAADYCNWAVFRKAERADERSFSLLQSAISFVFNGIKSSEPTPAE